MAAVSASIFNLATSPPLTSSVCMCAGVCKLACVSFRCHFSGEFLIFFLVGLLMLLGFVVWGFILFFETASLT